MISWKGAFYFVASTKATLSAMCNMLLSLSLASMANCRLCSVSIQVMVLSDLLISHHILFICFGELIIILFPDAFLCISMIFYSLSYMFIQIYYSCFFTHFNNIFKYMVLCSICLQFFYFYYPVLFSPFIFIIIWISSTGLFIYYYKGLLYGNF